MKRIWMSVLILIVGMAGGLALSGLVGIQSNGYASHEGSMEQREVPTEAVVTLSGISEAMVQVVETIRPSVVNISTTRVVQSERGGRGINPMLDDPFFRRFFGDQFGGGPYREPRERRESSLGSGIIVDARGYILTNNHVVQGADEIVVRLYDEREFKGMIVGTDPKTDLAVIKIEDGGALPVARLGDSDRLRVGEFVIAVGSPYGLAQSVTSGIVSATGRSGVRISDYEDFIQTDAAINPGNSGGPLINIRGEVVGINTAIFSTSGGYQGIGFAIPLNMARVVMEGLISEGRVVRGWLGVSIQPISEELARQFGITGRHGALISDVMEDGPAGRDGLKRGDVIVEYAGKRVENPSDLRNAVARTHPGEKVDVKILRDGLERTLQIRVGELPSEQTALGEARHALRGVQVQDLTPAIRRNLGISERVGGVVVSFAEREIGLQRGDVILEIGRETVNDTGDYERIAGGLKEGADVLLLVYRGGSVFYMTIPGQ